MNCGIPKSLPSYLNQNYMKRGDNCDADCVFLVCCMIVLGQFKYPV